MRRAKPDRGSLSHQLSGFVGADFKLGGKPLAQVHEWRWTNFYHDPMVQLGLLMWFIRRELWSENNVDMQRS